MRPPPIYRPNRAIPLPGLRARGGRDGPWRRSASSMPRPWAVLTTAWPGSTPRLSVIFRRRQRTSLFLFLSRAYPGKWAASARTFFYGRCCSCVTRDYERTRSRLPEPPPIRLPGLVRISAGVQIRRRSGSDGSSRRFSVLAKPHAFDIAFYY